MSELDVASVRAAILLSASLKALAMFSTRARSALDVCSRALGHPAVGLGKGDAGLLVERVGDFQNLVAQRTRDHHCALFEHLTDIVDAEVQRALHRAGALFDDAGLAAERLFDLLDVGGDRLRDVDALAGDRLDMGGNRRIDLAARLGELAEILVERLRHRVASVCQARDVDRDNVVEHGAAFRDLLQVCLQRPGQGLAAFRDLLYLRGNQSVDIGARLGQLVDVGLESAGQICRDLEQASRPGRPRGRRCRCGFPPAS